MHPSNRACTCLLCTALREELLPLSISLKRHGYGEALAIIERRHKMVSLALGSLVGLLLMGGPARCDEIVNPSETTRSQLAGSSWELLLLERNGQIIRPSTGEERITLTFDAAGRHISGSGGCNAYGGSVLTNSEGILFTGIVAGQMACDQNLMVSERSFFNGLSLVTRWQRSGADLLQLFNRDGHLRLEFTATKKP